MNAQEINTLGGVCQLWGIALIVRDLVAAHILRGDPARLRRWLTKVRVFSSGSLAAISPQPAQAMPALLQTSSG